MSASRFLVFAWALAACSPVEITDVVEIPKPVVLPTADLEGDWFVKFEAGGSARVTLVGDREILSGNMQIDQFDFRTVYGTASTNAYELRVFGDHLSATGNYSVAGTSFTLVTPGTKANGALSVDESLSKTPVINGLWNIGDGSLGRVRWVQAGSVLLGGSEFETEPVIVGVVNSDGSFFAKNIESDPTGYYQGNFNTERTVATVNVTTTTISTDVTYTRIGK